jgi:membrane protein YqaA with SNARE-associated domain
VSVWVWLEGLAYAYGYPGVFLLALLCNLTFFLPAPLVVPIYAMGVTHNPIFLGLSSGVGSAIGEFSSYFIGKGGSKMIMDRYERQVSVTRRLLERHGASLIFLFALTPLPDDLLLVTYGIINYDLRKAFTAMLLGKILMNTIVAFAGKYSFEFVWGSIVSLSPFQLILFSIPVVVVGTYLLRQDWTDMLLRLEDEE